MSMNRTPRQKINKKILAVNNTLDQMSLTDIYRTFHSETEYTFKYTWNILQDGSHARLHNKSQ